MQTAVRATRTQRSMRPDRLHLFKIREEETLTGLLRMDKTWEHRKEERKYFS